MEQISLFNDIPDARDSIFAWDREKGTEKLLSLPSGRIVFHEGNKPEYIYEVLSGTLKLSKVTEDGRQLILGFPTAGEIIGLGAPDEYLHSAETVSAVTLLPVLRKNVEAKFAQNAPTVGRLLIWAGKQLTGNFEHVSLLANTRIQSRVAAFLLKYVRRQSGADVDSITLHLPMTQRDIASYLAIAPETYSRALRKFREAHILGSQNTRTSKGDLVICNAAKLQQIALGENF